MKKIKEITACIVALLILVYAVEGVSATDTNIDWDNIMANNSANNTNDNYQQIQTVPPVNNTNTNTGSIAPANNTNTTVPYTGINNTGVFVIIGICGISAIYAYKKIRDYNIK